MSKAKRKTRMLVIAPHPDDEVLGTGGTITRFAEVGGEVWIVTVAAHMPPLFTDEVHRETIKEARSAHGLMGVKHSVFLDHPAVFLGDVPVHELNGEILTVVADVQPNIFLMPYYDRHVDHRHVFDACAVAARPVGPGRDIQLVAAYETLSETHWNAPHLEPNFVPNWCVDITPHIETKIAAMQCYSSQVHAYPMPRSIEALRALALFRGSQAGVGYAEGFHIIRMAVLPAAFS